MFNILFWRMRLSSFRFFFFFFAIFLPILFALLFSLSSTPHILSFTRKKLGVNNGLSLEMGPSSNICIIGLFVSNCAPKTDHVFFHLLRRKAVDIQNGPLCGKTYPSSVIYSSRISGSVKLVTSQVVQRAWPIIHAYMRGYTLRVKFIVA